MLCWMNGEYVEQENLKVSPFDHGFLYGLGFFETFRTYNGKPLFLREHLARLKHALSTFRIAMPYTEQQLREVIEALNNQNGGDDGYFRLNVSAGEHEIGLAPTTYEKPNVIVFRKALPKAVPSLEKTAVLLQTVRNTPEAGNTRFKSHHYGNNVFARFELPSLATQEGIFLTQEGFVAEGITSNIFWVKGDTLYTPALQTGILAGITRSIVIRLAKELLMNIEEGEYRAEELFAAEECFMTTAVQQIVPVKQIQDVTYLGLAGNVTQKLMQAYEEYIAARLKEEDGRYDK
jgi:4-amino-4-deoxychorismate lyase